MDYQKFKPAPELQPFVECYFIWSGETSSQLDLQSPPSGYAAIVFNNGDPYKAYQLNTDIHLVPNAFVSGQFTYNYHLVMEGKIRIAGLVFKPSGIYNYFKCRMSELVNTRKPLDLLLGRKADELLTALEASRDNQEKILILENFLKSHLLQAKQNLSIIEEAVNYIDACNGCISIEAVANHFKMSRRYLEKKFLEKIGISPKLYTRIKRFSVLSNKVAHLKNPDWQEIVLESGLHDQSHLYKEYNEFNRMSPNEYYNHNKELLRLVRDSIK
jgi:AraC-like DNA-binding protein